MSDPDPHPPRFRRRLGIFALQLSLVITGLVLLEVGLRGYFWIQGKPYDPEETLKQVQHFPRVNHEFLPKEAVNQAGAGPAALDALSLHPYLGWDANVGFDQIDRDNHEEHTGESLGAWSILVVGGSVAGGFCGDQDATDAVSAILSSSAEIPRRRSRFMNLGRGGYKEPQQINFVVYLLSLGFKPDIVVNIDGFNEVALGNNNKFEGWHPIFPSAAHWSNLLAQGASDGIGLDMIGEIRDSQSALERWSERFERWHLEQSSLLGTLALKRMYRLRVNLVSWYETYARHLASQKGELHMRGPPFEGDEAAAIEASVKIWKESSRSLNDICREHGIVYLHLLQPTLHDAGSKPATALELEHGWMPDPWMRGVKLGYPRLRQEGEDLRRSGVEFVDASMLFGDHTEDVYYDACHYMKAGNMLLAQRIGSELVRCLRKGR